MNTRRGVSLIELLVVMSASTVVLTMSAMLVHRIMHVYSQARAFHNVERNSCGLSQQFRRDVHQAIAATTLEASRNDGAFLRLRLADGQTLDYREINGSVTCTQSDGDKIVSRDAFTFPPGIKLTLREDGRPRRLILSITVDPMDTPDKNGKSPWNAHSQRVNLQAEAVLGRDERFATTSATEPLR